MKKYKTTKFLSQFNIVLIPICEIRMFNLVYCLAFKKVFWSNFLEPRINFTGFYSHEILIDSFEQRELNPNSITL